MTGSCASDMLATVRSGEAAVRRDLRTKLALERLTGRSLEDDYLNADMKRGIELEPDARAAYEALTGALVQQTGFLVCEDLPIGCSLDGYCGDYRTIWECKAPRPANHLKYLRAGVLPPEHTPQILHNLLVTGAERAVFCSYSPVFPEPLRLFVTHYTATAEELAVYESALRQFLREVDAEYQEIVALQDAALVSA
jgi:hypothetical protein